MITLQNPLNFPFEFNLWNFYANVRSFGFLCRTERARNFNSEPKQLFDYNVQRGKRVKTPGQISKFVLLSFLLFLFCPV